MKEAIRRRNKRLIGKAASALDGSPSHPSLEMVGGVSEMYLSLWGGGFDARAPFGIDNIGNGSTCASEVWGAVKMSHRRVEVKYDEVVCVGRAGQDNKV